MFIYSWRSIQAFTCLLAIESFLIAANPLFIRSEHSYSQLLAAERSILSKRTVRLEKWNPKPVPELGAKDIFNGHEAKNSDRNTHPTFFAKMALSNMAQVTSLSIATEAYNYVITQLPQARHPPTDSVLVAVFKVPSGSGAGYYIATIPNGPAIGYLKANKIRAPAWKRAAGNRMPNVFHAEDMAEIYYEMENPDTNEDFLYPAGSTMTAYGSINGGPVQQHPACSVIAAGAPNPTCQTIKNALNIL